MPFNVGKHGEGTFTFPVNFGGQTVRIEYRRGIPARNFEQKIEAMQQLTPEQQREQGDGGRYLLCEALTEVIVGWDLVDGEDKKVPVETQALNDLPIETAFYTAITQRLSEELATGKGTKKA